MPECFHPLMPITREGPIALVTFNRPEVRNSFTPRTVEEMRAALLDAKGLVDGVRLHRSSSLARAQHTPCSFLLDLA